MKLTGVALLSLFITVSANARRLEFSHTEYGFGTGHVTGAPALADVNGDGRLDILIVQSSLADPNISVVHVMLGDGAGNFGDPVDFAVGPNPFAVVAADLNHDGAVDLVIPFAVGDHPSGVTILMGDGHGAFPVRRDYHFGIVVNAAAIADLDGDGQPDIVATSIYSDSIFILHGHGDGTFADPIEYKLTGSGPQALTLADFDNDGRIDIATADGSSNTFTILLAQKDSSYKISSIPVGHNPFAVISGDFNEDGRPDLIAVNDFDFTYTALMGRGDGTFDVVATNNAYGYPEGAIAGDFNGDGHLDFAIGNSIDGVVSIFAGHGDGTFDAGMSFPAGNNAYMLAAGDIDHDSDLDLVVANAGAMTVLRNDSLAPKRRAVRVGQALLPVRTGEAPVLH